MSTERNTEFCLRVNFLTLLYNGPGLFSIDCTWTNKGMTRELVLYIFLAIALYTQVHSQLNQQSVLLLLHVSTVNRSHLNGATKCRRPVQRTVEAVEYKL